MTKEQRKYLMKLVEFYENVPDDELVDLQLHLDACRAHVSLGDIYRTLGAPKQAIKYNIADEIVDFFKEREITMEELNATNNQEPDRIDYQEDDYPSQDSGYKTYSISDLIQSFDGENLYDLQERIEREIERRTDPSTNQG